MGFACPLTPLFTVHYRADVSNGLIENELVHVFGGLYQGAEGAGFGMSTEDLKVWFGILSLIVVELGLITPPVGLNVFVISALAKDIPMIQTFKGVAPFFGAEMVRVVILLLFPAITLWLPKLLSG